MTTVVEPAVFEEHGEMLKPYVPRLLIDWVRTSPNASYRPADGTLVFVDISGFTALTERLAGRGKISAELLRDTLDGVFRALLDEAYEWGAGLLKWGGDALLLLCDPRTHTIVQFA
jgi:class 3 adenylate cyclase